MTDFSVLRVILLKTPSIRQGRVSATGGGVGEAAVSPSWSLTHRHPSSYGAHVLRMSTAGPGGAMRCQRCRKEVPPGAKFCAECGAQLAPQAPPPVAQSPGALASWLGDLQPVLTAIAGTAARLCDAKDALIYLVDGDQFRLAAKHGPPRDPRMVGYTLRISRGGPGGRAVLERRTVHVRDLAVSARTRFPDTRAWQQTLGWRTVLATPLLRNGSGIGVILILLTRVRPFTAKQVALLQTFADQAAIAIENARLSQEVAARNRDLTEALDQQTATSGILRVISSSPPDVQPVFDAIADSAARLCEADDAEIYRVDGDVYRRVAHR